MWPQRPDALGEIPSDDVEVKGKVVTCALVTDSENLIDSIIEWFSSWYRLKKFVAWLMRYKGNLREVCRSKKSNIPVIDRQQDVIKPVTVNEIKAAESELLNISKGGTFPKK